MEKEFKKQKKDMLKHCKKELAKWDIIPSAADEFAWSYLLKVGFYGGYQANKQVK